MLEVLWHRSQVEYEVLTLLGLIHQLARRWCAWSCLFRRLWLLNLAGRKCFQTLIEPCFILCWVKIGVSIPELHNITFCLLVIKNGFFILSFASLLSQGAVKFFVRLSLIKLNSTHLIHLLKLLETVCGDRLCSVVLKKWWAITVYVGYFSLALLFCYLFGGGLARSQLTTSF